ncbi:MAG: LrgB family protein [Ruminococcus sp.]|nr:LrgB family protein [Ruminococcus sp.]MCD7800763.1 LrgB family protein [Ruminococcus sp.]
MIDFFIGCTYFGVALTIGAYLIGLLIKDKLRFAIFNPMLIAIILIIVVLVLLKIPYDTYYDSTTIINYLLTPSTICLAVPLYEKLEILKGNIKAILIGILSGIATCMLSIFLVGKIFSLSQQEFVTFLPKSLTTAIGMAISEELGGVVAISVAVIMITGITGSIIADFTFRLFNIHEPVAKGLALGTASHVIGTTKAIEYGKVESAVSSLSIAVTGLLTVIIAPIVANLYV